MISERELKIREARLPKWAQDELARIRRNNAVLQTLVDDLAGRIAETNTFVIEYGRGKDWPLPNNARVGFEILPDDGRTRRQIQVYVEDGKLRVQGDYSFLINPEASNRLTIQFRER